MRIEWRKDYLGGRFDYFVIQERLGLLGMAEDFGVAWLAEIAVE